MKKMKSLFKREFSNHKVVKCLNIVEEGCKWVLNGEGYATEKLDGTCCLIENGKIYRRFDYKPGRRLPEGAIPCQERADEVTGHFPHWVLCKESNPNDKYHILAFKKLLEQRQLYDSSDLLEGTYELCGKHFQDNPYNLDYDVLLKHGTNILNDVPRTYEGIKNYLETHYIEGIVFYRGNGEMFEESGLVICPIAFPEYQYCNQDCENCNWNKEFIKGLEELENDKNK